VELLSIGNFARLTGLTVRAVRHYGELGLLEPAFVDPESGYRYYAPEQIRDAQAIKRLRFLELPLDDIREILDAADRSFTRARLVRHRAKMAELAATTEQILTDLQRLIEGEEELVPGTADIRSEVEIRDVAEQPMLLIREHAALDELSQVIPRAIDEVHAHMTSVGGAFTGPPVVLYPAMYDDGTVDVETGWPVADTVPGGGRVEYATVPGGTMLVYSHRGPYDELSRAHRALWELVEREGLTVDGAAREIYLTDPSEVPNPVDWVTEIQIPIVRDEARIAALAGTAS
jgi:effector-binding domain-containing protein